MMKTARASVTYEVSWYDAKCRIHAYQSMHGQILCTSVETDVVAAGQLPHRLCPFHTFTMAAIRRAVLSMCDK